MAKSDITVTEVPEAEAKPTPEPAPEVVTPARPKNVPLDELKGELPPGYHWDKNGKKRKDYAKRKPRADKVQGDLKSPRTGKGTDDGPHIELDVKQAVAMITESVHAVLGVMIGPGCAMDHETALTEGEAVALVLDQYDIDPNSKQMALLVMAATVTLCEMPTILAVSAKVRSARSGPATSHAVKGELESNVVTL